MMNLLSLVSHDSHYNTGDHSYDDDGNGDRDSDDYSPRLIIWAAEKYKIE